MDKDIVFLSGARTAFGTFGGTLKNFTATDLGVFAARGALERAGIAPEEIQHVIFGNAQQTSADALYLARHVGLRVGVPVPVPALTVNRVCGSGFQSIVNGAQMLLLGEADFVLAGGTESMSQAPHVVRGARWGIGLGQGKLEDSLWTALTDTYCDLPMALTAENLASRFGVTRQACDEFAYRSQQKTKAAQESGKLAQEIVPVEIKGRRGEVSLFDRDEHPRPGTTLEGLAALKPYFKKDGVVTAGNASGISDGAAAVVLSTAGKARQKGIKPFARLVSWGIAGCDPDVMGFGPVPASRLALERSGRTLDDMDVIEVNEAFAGQYLAVEKELGLDREKVNVNGGAIAIGHPLGASGTRLTVTLLYELRARKAHYGLATACIGGGQGIALVVEAL